MMVAPAPAIVPPVQLAELVMERSADPDSVPPASGRARAVEGPSLLLSVPPDTDIEVRARTSLIVTAADPLVLMIPVMAKVPAGGLWIPAVNATVPLPWRREVGP